MSNVYYIIRESCKDHARFVVEFDGETRFSVMYRSSDRLRGHVIPEHEALDMAEQFAKMASVGVNRPYIYKRL